MSSHLKKILSIFCLLTIISSAFAIDYGFELSNTAGIKNVSSTKWYTDHKATMWLSIPFNKTNSNSLSIEGSAYAAKPAEINQYKFFADLDLFRLTIVAAQKRNAKVSFDAGRIPAADVTGIILAQSLDGLEIHNIFAFGNLDITLGYTGLLNSRKGGAIMTSDDANDASKDEIYTLGSKRAVGKITLQLQQVAGLFDFILEGSGQYDVRRNLESNYQEVIDTAYGTALISAPITNKFYYSLSGTYQTGVLTSKIVDKKYSTNSYFVTLRFDVFPAKGNQMFFQATYVPANDSTFSGIKPISQQTLGTFYTATYTNVVKPSLGWYINPSNMINIDLGGKVFLHPVKNEANSNRDFYYGTEANAGATIKATSDLRLRLDATALIPASAKVQYQGSLKAILSF